MKILLSEFEHQIDEKILKRGLDYFKKGHVTSVNKLGDGDYEIIVEGTETYTVRLSIKGDVVTEYVCDCPYDMGPVCKHVVAALFYLQRNSFDAQDLSIKRTSPKPRVKSETKQVDELLHELSYDDLKTFIHERCDKDHKFRQLFITKHLHLLYPESKALYSRQLQSIIKTYSDRDGFIDYQESRHLSIVVSEMSEEAMAALKKGQIQKAIFIASAIIEEMTNLYSCGVDDSDGEIGGCIKDAFNILETLTDLNLNETQHDELFGCLLSLFEKESLKEYGDNLDSLQLAIKLVKTNEEKEKIKSALNEIKPNGDSWDFDYEKAQELMLELIKKTENTEAVAEFLENNISNSHFRAELIQKAIKAKDYSKAECLANDGIAKDEKNFPGLADNWRNYLLTIYQETKDQKNTIRLARYFFIYSRGESDALQCYYKLLKSLIPKDQWENYVIGLVDEINKKSKFMDYDRISILYILEKDWDKLFELLQQSASFSRIEESEKYLGKSYSTGLAALYKKCILSFLENNMGRKEYQMVCRYIRRMIKLGARPMAVDLIQKLKTLYPTRRALREELDNV